MKFEKIWEVIDKFALTNGMSPSALAKSIGLDATTFNPAGSGTAPAAVPCATGQSAPAFSAEAARDRRGKNSIYVPQQFPAAGGKSSARKLDIASWRQVNLPYSPNNMYAIDLDNSAYEPLYNFGATLVVAKDSEIRRGDRIVIITQNGETFIREFIRREEGLFFKSKSTLSTWSNSPSLYLCFIPS